MAAPDYGDIARVDAVLDVAFLQLVVGAAKVGTEGYALWGKGYVLLLDDLCPFALGLPVLEWLPVFPVGVPGVFE